MDEAERLCDRVALIDRGRVVAAGAPSGLAEEVGGGTRLRFRPSGAFDDTLLTCIPGVRAVERRREQAVVSGSGDVVTEVVQALGASGIRAGDLRVERATLEDAFISLTGHGIDETDGREVR